MLLARDDNLLGRWMDGVIGHSVRWLLVDDVASDSERLAELIERARAAGLRLNDARFIVSRREGDAIAVLEREGVRSVALREWDDEQLRQLRAAWRRSWPMEADQEGIPPRTAREARGASADGAGPRRDPAWRSKMSVQGGLRRRRVNDAQGISKMCCAPEVNGALKSVATGVDGWFPVLR